MAMTARPTLYRGIQMRSRLEADYAARLDRRGLKWEFEPTCFAGPNGQWVPDFRVTDSPLIVRAGVVVPRPVARYVELKPAGLLVSHYQGYDCTWQPSDGGEPRKCDTIDGILRRMTVAWDSEPDASLELIYWEYGVGEQVIIGCSGQGNAWMAEHRAMVLPMLWTGMGQFNRCKDR